MDLNRDVPGTAPAGALANNRSMADRPDLTTRENALREDMGREYYALLDVVSDYDRRLIIIKGWSVTLSLAGLGLGFEIEHYALFGLAAVSGLAFWFVEAQMKGFQVRYYSRMRDIEQAAFLLNSVPLGALGRTSSPRIDMSWPYSGDPEKGDWRTDMPERRKPQEVRRLVRRRFYMGQVMFPHMVAVVIGAALFFAASLGALGSATL